MFSQCAKRAHRFHLLLATSFCLLLHPVYSVFLPNLNVSADHQAHAKPGGPYFSVDWNLDGIEVVTVDATQSHTHFFHHGPPPVSGTIVSYQWYSVVSGKKLLETSSPFLTANFYVGVTLLKLVVTDSTGDTAQAYTYVSVRKPSPHEMQPPQVQYIQPPAGPISGATLITVHGIAFYNNPSVSFAGSFIKPHVISNTKLTFRAPPVDRAKHVRVYVTTGFGTSAQIVTFQYRTSNANPVHFRPALVRSSAGQEFYLPEITSIKIGPDASYYVGSQDGYIYVLNIDRHLIVRSFCKSHSAGPHRSVLGLAFDPNAHDPYRLFVSTSVLEWPTKPGGITWHNGRVELWMRRGADLCPSRIRHVITGLPVSVTDHGVSALVFRPDGKLLIAVAGATNGGVPTSTDGSVIAIPESPLSAAILLADVNKENFDGRILYEPNNDPGKARVVSGDVKVFAAGLRSVFGMTRHSGGKIYALDNGPNIGFGPVAVDCGRAGGELNFRDKLLQILPGRFYGHANWNRGRFDKRQCAYVRGDSRDKGMRYTAAVALVESSTNGIVEYTANLFDGKMRGDLVLSRLSWTAEGILLRGKLNERGTGLRQDSQQLYNDSGIAVEMGPRGELIMPKIKQGKILGMIPVERNERKLRVISVVPNRGPRDGGNVVMVSGDGLKKGVRIEFGGLECERYWYPTEDGSIVRCQVPPYEAGRLQVEVIAWDGEQVSYRSRRWEYEYMEQQG